MLITNWLAKKDGHEGLALPHEIANGNVRIYGNVYGHPDFDDGEYVQTAFVTNFDGVQIRTASDCEFTLIDESPQYLNYIKAVERGAMIVKNWSVVNGKLVGRALDFTVVEGKVIAQSFRHNICTLEDGQRIFVDWLAKDPNFNPEVGYDEFLVFCTERCMPDIFCKHYGLFKGGNCR
ncbi:MAG: hypothetical protein IJ272_00100 [Clostridia bacterium]|nr:hypothetical protein [Clostridia bacterium]